MYGKEFNEIDKIVISSEFEKKNLVENYKYNEEVFAFILLDDISICMQQRRRNIAGRDIASCH